MSASRDWPYPFVRLYAQVQAGRFTCPGCGHLCEWGSGRKDASTYTALTSVLQCVCGRSYQLGVLAWPVRPGPRRVPHDQRPSPVETAQLLARAGGFWVQQEQRKRSEEPVNRYLEEECGCGELPWRAECPIHGSEARREEATDGDDT